MFVRMLCSDFRRMFQSPGFYLAMLGVVGLTYLNVWPEAAASEYSCSIYYLVLSRRGIGAFMLAMTVLAVLPYGLSLREDMRNNYIHGLQSRVSLSVYGWSHGLTAAAGAFLVVFLGYVLAFGSMAVRLPMIRPEERETVELTLFYFIVVFATEAVGYAFLAVLPLLLSVKIENSFILLSVPILFYHGSQLLCSILDPPGIFWWFHIMASGGIFNQMAELSQMLLCVCLYFGGLICVECLILTEGLERRRRHG